MYPKAIITAEGDKGHLTDVSAVDRIFNFHFVAPGIMRASQPPMERFEFLKERYNLKTVLSFRQNNQVNEQEKQILKAISVDFINIPMNAGERQSIEKIEKCLNIITDPSRQPILIHCHGGKDRTGLISAAYRIKYNNWSLEDALTEMLAYGYNEEYRTLKESLIRWDHYVHAREFYNDPLIHRRWKRKNNDSDWSSNTR